MVAGTVDRGVDGGVDVEQRVAAIAGYLNVQHALLVEAVADAVRSGGWHGERINTPVQWLTIHAGVSGGVARKLVTIAERVDEFPLTLGLFRAGGLSLEQVYEVAARAPGWADRQMRDFAQVATVAQLRRMIRDEHFDHDPEQPPAAKPKPESSGVSVSWDEHSRLQIHGALDADQGAVFEAAGREIGDALLRDGAVDLSWADVLTEMARRSLATTGVERCRRFLPSVHVHCDTGAIQLTNGVTLPPAIAGYLVCDSSIRPVWERDNVPFGVGRSQRSVPERTRRMIEHRDRGCRVPGCDNRRVDIHHIIPWSEGGATDPANLVSLCRRHHRLLHTGALTISGDADTELTVTDEHGTRLAEHPTPIQPTQPPPPPATPYEHPSGERLQRDWTALGWAHPNALAHRRKQLDHHHRLNPRT